MSGGLIRRNLCSALKLELTQKIRTTTVQLHIIKAAGDHRVVLNELSCRAR